MSLGNRGSFAGSPPSIHVCDRPGGTGQGQRCGLSQRSDILALCREAELALGIAKRCKGDVFWQCQALDKLSQQSKMITEKIMMTETMQLF